MFTERLNGSANEKYGIARSLSVMPGDTIKLEVYAKYVDTNSANWTAAFNTLMGQIAGGASGVVVDGSGYSTSTSSFAFGGLINTTGSTGGPKAYLNWLIFDRNFTFVNGGYLRLSSAPKENGQNVAHEKLATSFTVSEPSYVYTYLSNEEPTASPIDVYFDDFKVTQVHGTVVAGGDYYPYGLPMDTRQMSQESYRFGYQGQYSVKDSLTNWNAFHLRMYDSRFGRWISPDPYGQFASPYSAMGNNPITDIDPDGGWSSVTAISGFVAGAAIGYLASDGDMSKALLGGIIGGLIGGVSFDQHFDGFDGGTHVAHKNLHITPSEFLKNLNLGIRAPGLAAAEVAKKNRYRDVPQWKPEMPSSPPVDPHGGPRTSLPQPPQKGLPCPNFGAVSFLETKGKTYNSVQGQLPQIATGLQTLESIVDYTRAGGRVAITSISTRFKPRWQSLTTGQLTQIDPMLVNLAHKILNNRVRHLHRTLQRMGAPSGSVSSKNIRFKHSQNNSNVTFDCITE